jgi:hypothetical protein
MFCEGAVASATSSVPALQKAELLSKIDWPFWTLVFLFLFLFLCTFIRHDRSDRVTCVFI